jgi:hypothetical protein
MKMRNEGGLNNNRVTLRTESVVSMVNEGGRQLVQNRSRLTLKSEVLSLIRFIGDTPANSWLGLGPGPGPERGLWATFHLLLTHSEFSWAPLEIIKIPFSLFNYFHFYNVCYLSSENINY